METDLRVAAYLQSPVQAFRQGCAVSPSLFTQQRYNSSDSVLKKETLYVGACLLLLFMVPYLSGACHGLRVVLRHADGPVKNLKGSRQTTIFVEGEAAHGGVMPGVRFKFKPVLHGHQTPVGAGAGRTDWRCDRAGWQAHAHRRKVRAGTIRLSATSPTFGHLLRRAEKRAFKGRFFLLARWRRFTQWLSWSSPSRRSSAYRCQTSTGTLPTCNKLNFQRLRS